jgi:NTE family protein
MASWGLAIAERRYAMSTDPEVDQYLAQPKSTRHGIALALSGGGYRAALFHLGAARRLNELGILHQIDSVTSVSGGSIFAAHLATRIRWPLAGPLASGRWESEVAAPFRQFTRRDIRTGSLLKRALPWKWFDGDAESDALANQYEKHLTRAKLIDLPEWPRFILCSTDLAFGVNWIFEKSRMGDYKLGYREPPPADWPLARAVAASSCFPPVFRPVQIRMRADDFKGGKASKADRDMATSDLRINDGGNYDNLGLEPVWKTHQTLLCSDGGGAFKVSPDEGTFDRIARYSAILYNQVVSIRKRWLISNFSRNELEGTYWGCGSSPASYGHYPGYSKALATDVISQIRTDLDKFSDEETGVLENHGYLLVDAAIQRHVSNFPNLIQTPLVLPYPDLMDEGKVRDALKNSHKTKIFGR